MKRKEIPAATEEEFATLLREHQSLEPFESKNTTCEKCKKIVSWDNLLGYKLENGKILLYCNDVNCMGNRNECD